VCGIFGILRPDGGPVEAGELAGMGRSLAHRGPDQRGTFAEPGLGLGVNRLSIVDLKGGDQPLANEDGSLVIAYNGETYNHPDLRQELLARGHCFRTRSDTETVLHAFEEYGPDCLIRLEGMFALAIWDRKRRRLFLARDRLGIKPLYLARLEKGLAFASEAKALLGLLPQGPGVDWTAVHRYLSFGYPPGPETPFAGVTRFPAGHWSWSDGRDLDPRPFWQPAYGLGPAEPEEGLEEKLLGLIREAVRRELMADVPLGVFLSGGIDSSVVALLAREALGPGLMTFALRFEEESHDESRDAHLVADHLGTDHRELLFSRELLPRYLAKAATVLDEPFADPTVLPLLALAEFARQEVKVVLTGWGGDEIFAGYQTYRAHRLARLYRRLPGLITRGLVPWALKAWPVSDRYFSFGFKARRFTQGTGLPPELQHFVWMGHLDERTKAGLLTPHVLEQVRGGTLDRVKDLLAGLQEKELISRIMHLDAAFFLEGNGLFQADRMTMAASLEARVPLLNPDLLAFLNPLPASLKMPAGRPKGLLRRVVAGRLPKRIIHKAKKGFGPPASAWIRGPLAGPVRRILDREKLEADGVFNHPQVARLLDQHQNRRADHGRAIWALVGFQMWYDRYIARRGSSLD